MSTRTLSAMGNRTATSRAGRPRRRKFHVEPLEARLMMYAVTGSKWSNPNVSVSFLPDGTATEGYVSNLFAELDAVAPRDVWQREIARSLQTWANVSKLNFHFVTDNGLASGTSGSAQGDSRFGDIRIGAHPLSNGYVAYAYFPSGSTLGGDITLNPNTTFKVGAYLDLFSTMLHEVGHSIGLNHSTSGTIMYATITSVYTGLAADDIAGAQAIYGARQHDAYDAAASNDTFATATTLSLGGGGGATLAADLTSMVDVDYYRVTAPTGGDGTLTVSVDARGKSFLAPKLSVYDAAGNLVASADVGSAYGTVATVSLSGLTAGQVYTIVADGASGDAFGMGAYTLAVQAGGIVEPPAPPPPPPPAIVADIFENNDTVTAAKYLGKFNSNSQTGLTVHSSLDVDYMRFQVSKSGTFRIATSFTNANGNLDLMVYDSTQNVLATSATSFDTEAVTLSLSAGKSYYVKVASPTGATNVYDLAIAKLGGKPSGSRSRRAHSMGDGTEALDTAAVDRLYGAAPAGQFQTANSSDRDSAKKLVARDYVLALAPVAVERVHLAAAALSGETASEDWLKVRRARRGAVLKPAVVAETWE